MSEVPARMTFDVVSRRIDGHGSVAECKDATVTLDTALAGRRLELLHENVKKYGTVFNTIAPGTTLSGVLRRASSTPE